jgi:hypothetical protein
MRDKTIFRLLIGGQIACGIIAGVWCQSFMGGLLGMFGYAMLLVLAFNVVRLWQERNKGHRAMWALRCLCGFVLAFGAFAFLVPAAAVVGGLKFIGNDVEWPPGRSSQVVIDPQQNHIVVMNWIGRIQIYDAQRRFVRGWWFPGGGDGQVKLRFLEKGNLQVWQGKQYRSFVFTPAGKPFRQTKITPEEFEIVQGEPYTSATFTTPWYLWPLTHPVYGWLTAAAGMAGSVVLEIAEKRLKSNLAKR